MKLICPEIVETARLRLRPLEIGDASFMLKLLNSEGWIRFIGDRNVHSVVESTIYIQGILSLPVIRYYVMENLDSREAMGIISLLQREDLDYPDVGFALLPEYLKLGFAREATVAFLRELFKFNTLPVLGAITLPENRASIQLLVSIGFDYVKNIEKAREILRLYELLPQNLR